MKKDEILSDEPIVLQKLRNNGNSLVTGNNKPGRIVEVRSANRIFDRYSGFDKRIFILGHFQESRENAIDKMTILEREVSVSDGRKLLVTEGGDHSGKPVFVLNGTPMSRLLYGPHVKDAEKRGIRLIGYDRPGYSRSTPLAGRSVADAAVDISAIADRLNLDRFAVWGISGGGPHALACAALLPKRVVAVSSLASPAPYGATGLQWFEGMGDDNVSEFRAALAGSKELEQYLDPLRRNMLSARAEDIQGIFETLLSSVDREVLTQLVAAYFAEGDREALRESSAGWRDDDLAFAKPWGFEFSRISVPLQLWHGKHDRFVPYTHGQWLAEHIPHVEAHLTENDGHLTLFVRRVPEVHSWLLEHF